MPKLDWHRLEAALVIVTRAHGYTIDRDNESGDAFARDAIMIPDSDTYDHLNLTEFARDLAKELGL